MKHFVLSELKEGYILQVRHLKHAPFGILIQRTLGSWAGAMTRTIVTIVEEAGR